LRGQYDVDGCPDSEHDREISTHGGILATACEVLVNVGRIVVAPVC
jgi:hypothetical protein